MSTSPCTFTFHSDPAHGWLEVLWTDLKGVNLNPTDFSRCSYRRGNTFFLEEDCDATKFVEAYEKKWGHKPNFREKLHDGRCFIRGLARIWGDR